MENKQSYFTVLRSFPYYEIYTFKTHEQRMFSKTVTLVMKTSDLLTHSHTMTPFNAQGKQTF